MYERPARSPELTLTFSLGLVKETSLLYQIKALGELEGRIQELMSFIPEEFLVKLVNAISRRLEKLVVKSSAHTEF